jgi:hypothetical protein
MKWIKQHVKVDKYDKDIKQTTEKRLEGKNIYSYYPWKIRICYIFYLILIFQKWMETFLKSLTCIYLTVLWFGVELYLYLNIHGAGY